MATYRKSRAFAPEGFFECEGRGLEWLGAAHAQGGPRVVQVYGWGKDYLDIERVGSASPTPQAARAFGAALARMHDAGAKYFGSAPDGYNGTCYFGPLQDPVKMDTGEWTDPISYFADGRLRPMVNLGVRRGELDKRDVELTERVIEALPDLMVSASAPSYLRAYSPNLAAGAILDGCCDEVLFGRLSFADPEFPNEIAATGTIDPKKVCVTCGKCGVLIRAGKLTGCVVRMPHPYLDILRSMNT